MASIAASGDPAAAISPAMSGGFAEAASWDGLYWCPWAGRCDSDAVEESDEPCESIEWLRWTAGRVSAGRLGRDGGGMVPGEGEEGGETAAKDSSGAETFRNWAYDEMWEPPLYAITGGPGALLEEGEWASAAGDGLSSSASRASSFSRGERGPS